jgi:hypothetical protein
MGLGKVWRGRCGVWGKVGLLPARSDVHQKDMGPWICANFQFKSKAREWELVNRIILKL